MQIALLYCEVWVWIEIAILFAILATPFWYLGRGLKVKREREDSKEENRKRKQGGELMDNMRYYFYVI